MVTKTLTAENLKHFADGELLTRAISGREDGFEELVRRYQKPMINYIYRILGSYEPALDVTQEVFIKVYNSMERYSSEYKFSTWLYRIAHNAAIDYLRRNSHREQSLEIEGDEGVYSLALVSHSPSPEKLREQSEWRTEIKQVIADLPEEYKQLIILRHDCDLSYDEIAEITELPLGTVKNRLFRAREMMRGLFIKRGVTRI